MEKGSLDDTFNAPALLQLGEARGRSAFPVKQHDYGGGVLSNGVVTRIKAASPPGSRHVIWRWAVGWLPPPTPPVTSDRHGGECLRPRATHRKDLGRCIEPGRDLGASRDPSRRTSSDDSPGPRRRTLSGVRPPLADRRPSLDAALTLKVVSLYPGSTRKAINRIDGQCIKGSNGIDPNSDSVEYHH
jgi:hypothetical protein